MGDDEFSKTYIFSLRTAVNLAVGAWDKNGRASHNILCTLAERHAKGFDQLTFLAVDGDGLV